MELPVSTRNGTSYPQILPLIWKYEGVDVVPGAICVGLLVVIPLHMGRVLSEAQALAGGG